MGLFIALVNIVLLVVIKRKNLLEERDVRFPSYVLLVSALLSNLFLLISLGTIYLINFR